MNWTAVRRLRLALVALALTIAAGTGVSMGFGDTPPPVPDSDVLARLRSVETTGEDALLVGASVQIGVPNPGEISIDRKSVV